MVNVRSSGTLNELVLVMITEVQYFKDTKEKVTTLAWEAGNRGLRRDN